MQKTYKIILIDDDKVDRSSFQRYLKKYPMDFEVYEVTNGKSGIKAYEQGQFDYVFLDYNLPDMNGLEVLEKILAYDSEASVVVLTGEGDEFLAAKVIKCGAADYLPKNALSEIILEKCIDNLEMRKERDLADRNNRAKSEFLARMSHELRTPMNAVLGFAQLLTLDKKDKLTQNQVENVGEIQKAGKHLLSLIDEVLDLSKIETREMSLSLESVDLRVITDEVFMLLDPLARIRNIKLCNQIDNCNHPWVYADRVRLKQVLMNLVSNAIKYNKNEGMVEFGCVPTSEKKVRFYVKDNGLGIPEEMQPRIFIPFDRLGRENTEISGTGIGLTISKNLVDLMQGTIEVSSQNGMGTCFEVEFSKGVEPIDSLNGVKKRFSKNHLQAQVKQKKHLVLYIEDNPANLKLVKSIFSLHEEIQLISAAEANLGIELAQLHEVDLILMDINLPGMDGVEALRVLHLSEKTNKIPAIAISANAMQKDIDRALTSGFKHYLIKPFDVDQLVSVVKLELNNQK